MHVFSASHLPPWAVDTLFIALLRITAYVYRTTCCIVPEAARHDQYMINIQEEAERNAGRTMDEFEVLADIGAPASQIVMHPHCDH
jgi:hypothetical protein